MNLYFNNCFLGLSEMVLFWYPCFHSFGLNLGFIIFTALLSVLDLDIYIWLGDGNAEVYSWMFQAVFGISCLILVSLPQ